jgi:hypothetical protein
LDHTCENGESAPDPDSSGDGGDDSSHINSEFSSGSSGSREPCTCGFCEGFEVEYSETDPHSGEVEDHSFKKASQVERCPRCGGINFEWRERYIAHCAAVGRRLGRKRHVYFVSFALIRSAADEADLGAEDSYEVLMERWDRVRRQINRRADQMDYNGVVAPRPSDERYHGHLLVYTSFTRFELMRALHTRGLDAFIQMPKDDADGPESFAAKKGAYVWENAASSSKARHISSQGNGTGYNSREARRRRQKAISGEDGDSGNDTPDGGGGQSPSEPSPNSNGRGSGGSNGHGGGDPGGSNPDPNRRNGWERAPPVDCEGGVYPNLDAALAAAKSIFTKRVGTRVAVHDKGAAELLKVYRDEDQLTCVVAMAGQSTTKRVEWGQVDVINPPTIRVGSNGGTTNRNRGGTKNGDGSENGSGTGDANNGGGANNEPESTNNGDPSGSGGDNSEGSSGSDGSGCNGNDGSSGESGADGNAGAGDGGAPDPKDGNGEGEGSGNEGEKSGKEGSDQSGDPNERFDRAARKSVVQTELPSRRRLWTTFNYQTGKAQASVLSPRYSKSN